MYKVLEVPEQELNAALNKVRRDLPAPRSCFLCHNVSLVVYACAYPSLCVSCNVSQSLFLLLFVSTANGTLAVPFD
jgi:hypothetical protein